MKGPHAPTLHGSLPPTATDPARVGPAPAPGGSRAPTLPATLADHAERARQALDPGVLAYFDGGAADEITLQENERAWQRVRLSTRVLRPLAGGHTRIELLGRTLAHPILVAPMAYQRMAHPHGERATALACAAQGAGLVLSTQATVPLEDVARIVQDDADRGPLWFQLYMLPDRGFVKTLIERVERAGFEVLVLTVDAPVQGARDRERRTGYRRPGDFKAVNLAGRVVPPPAVLQPGQSALFDDLLTHAPTWDDIAWLRSITRLPVLLKGITHPADALLAAEHGAAGIIVSNHGGRTLDTLPATAELLPAVVQAMGGTLPVLVDGGIRRGTDVLKAMALGASAVLVGRPVIHGLANAGAQGVAHVLRLLRDELEIAMALCGCRDLSQASAVLHPPASGASA
jgi:4-hydroxymandelate oxidase